MRPAESLSQNPPLKDPLVPGPVHSRTASGAGLPGRRRNIVRNRNHSCLSRGKLEKPGGQRGQRPGFAVSYMEPAGETHV